METGDVLEIDSKGARKNPGGRVTVGRVCIDSGLVDEVIGDLVIRDRKHLSEDGIVLTIIAINKLTGKVETAPEVVARGFASDDSSEFMKNARQVVSRTLENSSAEEKMDWGVMKEKVRGDLKRYISKHTQRRPLIMPVILEI